MDWLQEEAKKEAALEARHKAIEEDELNKVSDTWFLKQAIVIGAHCYGF